MAKLITEKQQYAIKVIEDILSIEFDGFTRQDAFLWLRENVPLAGKRLAQEQAVTRIPRDTSFTDTRLDYLNKDVKDLSRESSGELLNQMNIDTCKAILGI
jgi:hypothetical protein